MRNVIVMMAKGIGICGVDTLLVDDGQPGLSPGEAISFLHIQTQLDFNKCSKYKAMGYIEMGVLGFVFRVLAHGALKWGTMRKR